MFTEANRQKFSHDGYCLLENAIPIEVRLRLKKIVNALADYEQINHAADFYDGTKNTQRIWNLLNKHDLFTEIIQWPIIMEAMEFIFDRPTPHFKYFLSSFQANILYPKAVAQKIHLDTPFPEPLPAWPTKANTIWLLDDFTEENGATEIVPGSHLSYKRPIPVDESKLVKVIAPAGTILVTHGALWHRSGDNKTGQARTVLLGSFAASYAREIAAEEDQVKVLDKEVWNNASDNLKKILGENHGVKKNSFTPSPLEIKKM